MTAEAPPPPDLTTPEGRAAYSRELAGVARPWRWIGLTLVAIGVVLLAAIDHIAAIVIGVTLIILGWVQVLMGIAIRTMYHKRRTGTG